MRRRSCVIGRFRKCISSNRGAMRIDAAALRQTNQPESAVASATGRLEITFRNDPSILDGRFANNAWLQELPKPITKLAWDNAVFVSPATAERLREKLEVSAQ